MNSSHLHHGENSNQDLIGLPSQLWSKGPENFTTIDKGIFTGLEIISGLICDMVTKVLNNTHIKNHEVFLNLYEKKNREGKGLLSVSNHTHYIDDPLLIAAMMNFKYLNSLKLLLGDDSEMHNFKWTPAEKRNFFYNRNHFLRVLSRWFFGRTKTVPVLRGQGLDQTSWHNLGDFLRQGDYVHVFGEGGRTRKIGELGAFKPGIGNLITAAPETIILPWGHDGIQNAIPHGCAPEVHEQLKSENKLNSLIANIGSRIQIVVGEPFTLKEIAKETPNPIDGYLKIAEEIHKRVEPCFLEAIELNKKAA